MDPGLIPTPSTDRSVRLRLEGVGKRFGSRTVLHGLSAEVIRGETLVVTGHNGSGKSTLLSLLAGLMRPDHGTVELEVDGQVWGHDQRRTGVGLVSPELALYHELTALENLELFARLRELPFDRRRGEELLAGVGLTGRGQDFLGSFSSGMRVRMRYAVALHAEPVLLLLDEPTALLDEAGAEMVDRVIAAQRTRGVLVLATNDPRERRHADLLLELKG